MKNVKKIPRKMLEKVTKKKGKEGSECRRKKN